MDEIHIFTDGSSINNQNKIKRRGGIGVFFGDNDKRNISKPLKTSKVTNQVAELTACVKGIEKLFGTEIVNTKQVVIYTDSMYIVNSMTKWAKKWEKNDWMNSQGKTVENKKLIKKLYYYTNNFNIIFRHVKAHKNEPNKNSDKYYLWYGNMMADKLATNASRTLYNI